MSSIWPHVRPYLVAASVLPVVATLYWGQPVLKPVALAILLTFLLSPLVDLLDRLGLARVRGGRLAAVSIVVVFVFSLLALTGWVIAGQLVSLAREIPAYKGHLAQKIADVRGAGQGGALERIQTTARDLLAEVHKGDAPLTEGDKPVPVVIRSDASALWDLPPLLERLASVGLIIVLVIFMLIERQDMRNRLLRLIGHGRLAVTTRALDEASTRISRYLLMQTVINGTYGVVIGIGLFLIGIPYATLWAALAFALRFIPYVGSFIGAAAPVALSLAVFSGWQRPFVTAGLFVAMELLANMVLEPLLYGQTAGVSQVALLVAVAFWTWLWGPIGLFLATPLTVCVVVLGKYVPALGFITVVGGDEPALEADVRYYQRLLARDPVEASDVVDAYVREHSLDQVYDRVLVPALSHIKRDRQQDRVTEEDAQFAYQATREIAEDAVSRQRLEPAPPGQVPADPAPRAAADGAVHVLGCSATDDADELALTMFSRLVDSDIPIEIISSQRLTSEIISRVAESNASVVCIAAVSPEGLPQTRYLCKRLRARFPRLSVLVGRWGTAEETEDERAPLLAAGADAVGTTLLESREQLRERITVATLEPAIASEPGAIPAPGVAD